MKQNTNKLLHVLRLSRLALVGALLALLPSSCSDMDEAVITEGGTAIQLITTVAGEETLTRAKVGFTEGDIIWVKATFTGAANTDKNKLYQLKLTGGKWISTETYGEFSWPEGVTGGSFEAYFIGNKTVTADASLDIPFADITNEEGKDDPLYAGTTGEITVGGAVHLLFAHTLTKLYMHGFGKNATIQLGGISSDKMTFSTATGSEGYTFSDRAAELYITTGNTTGEAVFFLHVLESGTPTLTLNGTTVELRPAIQNNMKVMKPGHAYYLDYGAGGANANLIELGNWWKEPLGCVPAVPMDTDQINEFLVALNSETAYQIGEKKILDETGKLLICLNFQDNDFTPVALTKAFDGDYHTIYNLKSECGLFTTVNSGASIEHLSLSDVTITQSSSAKIGAIAGINEGQLTDVHLKGVSTIEGNSATYIGGLVGENKANLNGLTVSGQLTVTHALSGDQDYYAGGMLGSSSAKLSRCVVSGAVKITTTGTTTKDACIGGLAGTCLAITGELDTDPASVNHCVANTQIDATGAKAARFYVGGFVGSVLCRVADCSASGYTIGGTGTSVSATGGFAGYVNHTNVEFYPNACSATGDVKATATGGNCYTGGLVGQSVINLKNCYSVGKVTMSALSTNQFTGGLIGMIAADKLIYNCFSMSELYTNGSTTPVEIVKTTDYNVTTDARLCGLRPEAKTRNCHYHGWLLNTKGGNESAGVKATELNLSVNASNQYLRWASIGNVYGGAPYLLYQQRP